MPVEKETQRNSLRGIILLVISVSLLGVVDGISKLLTETLSIGQIMLARYAMAVPVLLALTPPRTWPGLMSTSRPGLHFVRALAPPIISCAMILGVRNLPLADATAILFAGPFLVVILSNRLLGERVRLASWIGVVVGFAAVLIVARPGIGELSRFTVFPLIGAVFYALFQLLTRRLGAAGEDPNSMLAWVLAVGLAIGVPWAAMTWVEVGPVAWLLMAALGTIFGVAQALMARAFVYAPANVLTPFSYTQIITAAIFGMVVFGDVPDGMTLLGIAMIICAGAYITIHQSR